LLTRPRVNSGIIIVVKRFIPLPVLILKIADTELIQLVRSKKRAGAEALYDLYCRALFLAIIRIIPEKQAAEDVLVQTYLKAWNSIVRYDSRKGSVLSWMLVIARDLARKRINAQV
jgi:DNA-directed RNA polymerase specialized sigma24 family protein